MVSYGNFEPFNCRWITRKEAQSNRSNIKFITAWEETKSMSNWLEDPRCKVCRSTLQFRIKLGWDIERALSSMPKGAYKNPN